MKLLQPGRVKINVAEFLAALITCETFSSFCLNKFTNLGIDNRAAVAWINAARCPVHPFDRCAQGVHLHLLQCSMKIKAQWIPSSTNNLADEFSRHLFSRRRTGHIVANKYMLRIRPTWTNLLKYLKQ